MEAAADQTEQESTNNDSPENKDVENVEKPPEPQQQQTKKSKKEDRNKKEDKILEQFFKSLDSVQSVDEKLLVASKKYVETLDENKKLLFYIKQSDRRNSLVVKDREHLQQEYNKVILIKSKLENLCRELQKQNKCIKEESLLKIREEEERRKETQAKFQNTFAEITTLLQQNSDKNTKLREENISMTEKLSSILKQYQLREQQVDKMSKQMALESQLLDAKLQKASLEHQADRERLLAEMEQQKVTLSQYKAKILELQGTEQALKAQLTIYTDKYDEFQNALVKSNQVFGGFKEQMDMMSKKIKKLEKESLSWKKRWETSQTALLDMCGERQAIEERVAATTKQLQHMQSLCRTLQAERTTLLNTLKDNNIERPPFTVPPPLPAPAPPAPPAPANNPKMEAMVANCAQLRQSLAHLQSQLNVLTKKPDAKEESPKSEKQKKSKSKKNKSEKLAQISDVDKTEEGATTVAEDAANNQASASEAELQNPDKTVKKGKGPYLDEKTMESLIQAINLTNMNLNDLEIGTDDNDDKNLENIHIQEIIIDEPETQIVEPDTFVPEVLEMKPEETPEVALKLNEEVAAVNAEEVKGEI